MSLFYNDFSLFKLPHRSSRVDSFRRQPFLQASRQQGDDQARPAGKEEDQCRLIPRRVEQDPVQGVAHRERADTQYRDEGENLAQHMGRGLTLGKGLRVRMELPNSEMICPITIREKSRQQTGAWAPSGVVPKGTEIRPFPVTGRERAYFLL